MTSFSDIQEEVRGEKIPQTPYDIVRKKHLKRLSDKTGRNTILYYSGWLQKPTSGIRRLTSINDDDKNGFMDALQRLDTSKGLDIILHTPGGDMAATESLVDYLDQEFGGDMRAIIPQLAMSGGTIIACACKEILMGKQSSIGPIDPQINGLPASGIVDEFYHASEEMKLDQSKAKAWQPVLSGYYPSLVESCKKAISWSEELAGEYLAASMFKDELESDPDDARGRIKSIVNLLTNQGVTKSHARHIPMPICRDAGLKVTDLEKDPGLQDAVMAVHHAATLTMMNTDVVKIIENQDGRTYVVQYSVRRAGA